MKSYGFNELNGDWSLGLSDKILFDKMTPLRPESETQIQTMASRGGNRPEPRPDGWPYG